MQNYNSNEIKNDMINDISELIDNAISKKEIIVDDIIQVIKDGSEFFDYKVILS